MWLSPHEIRSVDDYQRPDDEAPRLRAGWNKRVSVHAAIEGCVRKNGFDRKDTAQSVAAAMSSRVGHKIRPYLCPVCHKYHVASAI